MSYLKEHYGDIASVIGLLVSLVGFVATIWNVLRAKQASEEAKQAARAVVTRIRTHLLINKLALVLDHVRAIDRSCRNMDWEAAIENCDEARTTLSGVKQHEVLNDSEKVFFDKAINTLGELIPYLESNQRSKRPRPVIHERRMELHLLIVELSDLHGRLSSSAIEAI